MVPRISMPARSTAGRRPAPPDVILRRATIDEIRGVRLAVLRPGLGPETARFDGDDEPSARHFGAFLPEDAAAVACVSCLRRPRRGADAWQVRGMATRADLARRGIGSALLGTALSALRAESGPGLLWCNARVTALSFWRQAGWSVVSEPFDIPGVGSHRVLEARL